MDKSKLSDGEWVQLMGKLKKTPGIRVGCETTCHWFVQAVLRILRAGAQWRSGAVAAFTRPAWALEQRFQALC